MNIPQAEVISQKQAENLLNDSLGKGRRLLYHPRKHQLEIESGEGWLAKLYLPWTMDWIESFGLKPKPDSHFCLVLIRAGQASTGYFHLGRLIDHKVFRAYMVRQKQGVSQIKHLKTKGKSRAGSRIRLAETARFFEEINERLTSYSNKFPVDFWGISCAKTMWPFYFNAAIPPPFSAKDANLIELPVHISMASFDELVSAGELLQRFHLIVSEKGKGILKEISEGDSETEDW
jgi:hypothetical protein